MFSKNLTLMKPEERTERPREGQDETLYPQDQVERECTPSLPLFLIRAAHRETANATGRCMWIHSGGTFIGMSVKEMPSRKGTSPFVVRIDHYTYEHAYAAFDMTIGRTGTNTFGTPSFFRVLTGCRLDNKDLSKLHQSTLHLARILLSLQRQVSIVRPDTFGPACIYRRVSPVEPYFRF